MRMAFGGGLRMSRKVLILGALGVLALAGLACQRHEPGAPPTLPPTPAPKTLAFRLVSAQTLAPVPGARVVVRRGRRAGEGEVLAEAVSGADGGVRLTYTAGEWDPVYLDIDAGERFLRRQAWVSDVRYEPAPDVRTLWELRPEVGADRVVSLSLAYGYGCKTDCGWRRPPDGDVYVYLNADFRPYRSVIERALERVGAAFGRRFYVVEDPAAPPVDAPQGEIVMMPGCRGGSDAGTLGAGARCPNPALGVRANCFRVNVCEHSAADTSIYLHEFAHLLGAGHLPPGVRGVMCGRGEDCLLGDVDYTEMEKWVFRVFRYRRTGNQPPDDGLDVQ